MPANGRWDLIRLLKVKWNQRYVRVIIWPRAYRTRQYKGARKVYIRPKLMYTTETQVQFSSSYALIVMRNGVFETSENRPSPDPADRPT